MTKDEACAILSVYQHIHRKDADAVEAFQMALYALVEANEDEIKVGDEIFEESEVKK